MLGELEQRRVARGISAYSGGRLRSPMLEQFREGSFDAASAIVDALTASLDRARIDEPFIAAKLERISRANRERGKDKTNDLAGAFANVHARYFEGDYEAANTYLNAISAMLDGRGSR